MQRRVVALVAAAIVVLGSVVVLMFRVRAAAESPPALPAEPAPLPRRVDAPEPRADAPVDRPPIPAESPPIPPPPPAPAAVPPELEEKPTSGLSPEELIARRIRMARDPSIGLDPALAEKREAVREAYDNGDYESARRGAEELLSVEPDNVYARRVVTVSSCAIGDLTAARTHYQQMDANQQRIVARRCRRFGVTF